MGEELIASEPPIEALRAWLLTFVDHVIEKQVVASALGETAYASARVVIGGTLQRLTERAVESGDLRRDIVAFDLLRALVGVLRTPRDVETQRSARRLVDLLLRGAAAI